MKITELVNKILEDAEFVDMTRMMEEGMPYWPTQPAFEAETIESQELGNESYFRKIVMCEHTGTHIDSGCHFVPGKPSVDEIPVTQIFGRAVNIDVTDTAPSGVVSVEKIQNFERKYGEITCGDIAFFRFGWDKKYGTKDYMENWPGISLEAGIYLQKKGVKAIGCDCLGNGVNILENVDKLYELPEIFSVIGLACKFKDGSGAPIRLIALTDKK